MIRFLQKYHEVIVDLIVLLAIEVLLVKSFQPHLLLLPTTINGGDTPSFVHPADQLRKVLLPSANPLGWDPGNFAGYAPFQFYNILPFALIAGLSWVLPFEVAIKLVSVFGVLLLPLSVYATFRCMRYQHPLPAIAACSILAFIYNEGNSMWGGNILSTLAGEFCFSIGLALAVAFWGALWRGIETGKGAAGSALLLAATGLSHPIPFLYAALSGTFFVFRRDRLLRNLGYLVRVYAGGGLLMSFWLIPLLVKIEYSTKINWTWGSLPFLEVFPKMMLPFLILAVINFVLFVSIRKYRDLRTAFFCFAILVNVIAFMNATAVGLPEIRFVPIVQVIVPLLAVDLLRMGMVRMQFKSLLALAMLCAIMIWVTRGPSNISAWVNWNYTGFEKKGPWQVYKQINDFLRGTPNDPRVFYEHSDMHNRFGSIRVFESIPYFSGRSTLEGVLLQCAINSPFIYYIQSETSIQATDVIPGYSYSRLNLERGTKHLEMYNVSHVIAVTDQVKTALDRHPSYRRVFERNPYVIYRLTTNLDHYVIVPSFKPVLLRTADWKQDFHRWFEQEALLDVPLVPADRVPVDEYKQFGGPVDDLSAVPHVPNPHDCKIDEKVSDESIEFTTSCPGRPHLIRISHFPNWKVEGARKVYLASPAFMLVFPEGTRVKLYYGRTPSDYLGIFMTLIGIVGGVTGVVRSRIPQLRLLRMGQAQMPLTDHISKTSKRLESAIPYAGMAVLTVALATGIFNYYFKGSAQGLYDRGWNLFEKNQYPQARRLFEKIRDQRGYNPIKETATFFIGQTYFRENNYSKAMEFFQEVVSLYPESTWVQESRYHIGLCLERLERIEEAKKIYALIIKEDPNDRWAGFSRERLQSIPEGAPKRLYDQGWKLFQGNKYPEARRLFEQIRSRRGYDPIKIDATFFIGQTYFRENNYSKAMEFFQEVVSLYPESTWYIESNYHIGLCLERLGRIEEAMQLYSSIIELNPEDRWAGFSKERLQALSHSSDKQQPKK